jgi:hypothetical protein
MPRVHHLTRVRQGRGYQGERRVCQCVHRIIKAKASAPRARLSRPALSLAERSACALAALLSLLPPFLGGGIAACPQARTLPPISSRGAAPHRASRGSPGPPSSQVAGHRHLQQGLPPRWLGSHGSRLLRRSSTMENLCAAEIGFCAARELSFFD